MSTDLERLTEVVETHRLVSEGKKPGNTYAAKVKAAMQAAEALIKNGDGRVDSLAASTQAEVQPIVEVLFGESQEGRTIGEHKDYSPTVFPNIMARTIVLGSDPFRLEQGPLVSVDLIAKGTLSAQAEAA